MGKLVVDQSKVTKEVAEKLVKVCPFGAIEYENGLININAGCKMCRLCVKKGPAGVMTYEEEEQKVLINKDEWKGVAVYMEVDLDGIHPVSFELIGKARELAAKINHPVYAVLVGNKATVNAHKEEVLQYGVDKLFVYEDERYNEFNVQTHARAMEDFIKQVKPTSVIYGGTPLGRSLAPRIAAHFRTGLTADCTILDMKENTDLVQVRPAFGGNVMAQIVCPNHRPQMATVRYKIFKMPEKEAPHGEVVYMSCDNIDFDSGIKLVEVKVKERVVDISEADVIVAIGRPFKNPEDFAMAEELAELLGGVVACTRPLIEAGAFDIKYQVGLSGKTVAPKLIINLGISGAVQYTAGMTGAELIISVNNDPNAAIFDVSHYGIVGDVFKVVPQLIENIKTKKSLL